MKVYVERIEFNDAAFQAFSRSPEMRDALAMHAEQIMANIAPSDGDPGAPRRKGDVQVNGRYRRKFIDRNAVARDGRGAVDVGVEGADSGFFRRMTLQRAVGSIGARVRRRTGG